ncbi:hypothetical protein [Colwellia sp. E2M01]|uniref:hypothetical protein n=1 Tax=Colwellia sp. E2M01 TaxID=2841561 RepID=UPI001C091645|nr:hypothetical protein [Colwellia sp. E2M01]MBU2871674.1 hypothetical protein [Colwellia sp. E2M01]
MNMIRSNDVQKNKVMAVMQEQFAVTVNNVQINNITNDTDTTITAFIADTPIDIFISTNRNELIQEQGAAAQLSNELYLGWNYH